MPVEAVVVALGSNQTIEELNKFPVPIRGPRTEHPTEIQTHSPQGGLSG
jgi:hypothetical protein